MGEPVLMTKIRIFYGSSTGNTAIVAKMIQAELSDLVERIQDIAAAKPDDLRSAEALILGASTWEYGQLQGDWKRFLPKLSKIDLTGKTVALFGLGNAGGFSGEFATGLGTLHEIVRERGAKIVGSWPADDYCFQHSGALEGDSFVGLVIDQESESHKTASRVKQWVAQIRPHFS
jgi:flavodoxin I